MAAHGPNTPVTPTPPVPGQQTPLTVPLPSLAEHRAVLLQLQATLNSAAAKLAELAPAEQLARDNTASSSRGDGDPDAVEKNARAEGERLSEKAEKIGKEVERILGEAQGIWAGMARLGLEMDQRAAEIVRLSRERRRLKGAMEGLCKENERLVPEMERLSLKYDEAVEKCPGKLEEWYRPLRLRENEAWDEFNKMRAKWVTVRIEMQNASEDLDRTEPERERLIMGLATVLSEKVKVESEARGSVVETAWLRVEADRLAVEVIRLKMEVEARESVVETERLRAEADRLAAEVVRLKVEVEARESVVKMEMLRAKAERLAAEVVRLKVTGESETAPRD